MSVLARKLAVSKSPDAGCWSRAERTRRCLSLAMPEIEERLFESAARVSRSGKNDASSFVKLLRLRLRRLTFDTRSEENVESSLSSRLRVSRDFRVSRERTLLISLSDKSSSVRRSLPLVRIVSDA